MAGTIKFKRGTEAARTGSPAVVPAEGEPIWTTDQKKLYVGDGSTAGGILVSGGGGDVVSDTTPQLGGDLDLNSNAITIELVASDTVAKGDVCYINGSGEAALIDASTSSSCNGQLVMAQEAITATNTGTYLVYGNEDGFSSLTTGAVYYASTTGTTGNTATTTAPSTTGEIVRKLYVATSTTTVFFNPSQDYGEVSDPQPLENVVEDTTPQLGGALDGQGNDINNIGVLFMSEQASAEADVAGDGQWWVQTATPNIPMFTNDAGTDFQLATLTGTETLTNKTLTDPAMVGTILEDIYTVSGTTPALDPGNGSIQTWTLTGASTPTDSFSAGEAITLMIDDGTAYTITWPTMTWVNNGGSAPTLATTGYTVVSLWKVSTTLYGALVGDGT